MKVETNRDLLKAETVNRLYKPALVRITAEYNVVSRDYRNAKLLEFVDHDNSFDEQAFSLFTKRGANAWKDVTDASDWVENIRGSAH